MCGQCPSTPSDQVRGLKARSPSPWHGEETGGAREQQPGGRRMPGLTAVGLMAFGAFAFVEARWRKIRAPRGQGVPGALSGALIET